MTRGRARRRVSRGPRAGPAAVAPFAASSTSPLAVTGSLATGPQHETKLGLSVSARPAFGAMNARCIGSTSIARPQTCARPAQVRAERSGSPTRSRREHERSAPRSLRDRPALAGDVSLNAPTLVGSAVPRRCPATAYRAAWPWHARTPARRSRPGRGGWPVSQSRRPRSADCLPRPERTAGTPDPDAALGRGPLVHRPAAGDQVHQRAQPRDDDDEQGPERLAPSGQLVVPENVGQDRDEQPDPGEQEHEPEDRQDDVPERHGGAPLDGHGLGMATSRQTRFAGSTLGHLTRAGRFCRAPPTATSAPTGDTMSTRGGAAERSAAMRLVARVGILDLGWQPGGPQQVGGPHPTGTESGRFRARGRGAGRPIQSL